MIRYGKKIKENDENCDIEETLYLSSIPGYVDDINFIRSNEVWKKTEEYKKDEEW